ncbi:PucR family transcriptional regulator [Streptomyces sp. NBC_01340]|uniref:PucR family transcriptional regulator n=1 Tax=unclassified Streptomyces TaxID=2593676 RepID=UPI00225BD093|nr:MULTISPECIES: PucR family transcriptional regulator [unclassified Streptomyces]MCX4453134.1 PucR family transcriptional regulator [Streptomyces sp. NBC_01719]MCX4492494.1 PucR family transcriptional regulator [Streptomyces sp. NBC_01728]MCX4592995.1 PucR family transcriptional regulator [Streptomyces sp. NBC_01549]WSI37658.1 PucR family transcriptional regulator [Streptomyces sp. NBC_01340]
MDSRLDSRYDTQGAGITVQRALELPGLRGGLPEILAGADRLGRTVRWVHAGEVPNIASLLKGGELLLTTGYGLGTRPADQRAFVRTLAERGIAALVVELGPRFTRLPSALVETARSAGLPLVQLHREVPFVAVTEEIHTEIVNGHYALLQQAEEVHRRCTEALLGGGGIPQVLAILADFSGNPVFLETADGQLLYAAGAGSSGADPLQVWEGMRGQHKEEPPAGTTLVDVPGGGPGTGSVRARLVLLPVSAPVAPVHRIAAERAAGILAVVLMQARQEEELAARGRGDFLTDLAEGRIAAEDAPAQARVLGFKPGNSPLLPVVMRLADGPSPGGGWAVLARAVAEELASVGVPVLLGVRPVEGRVPLLLGLRSESERAAVADRVAAALRAGVERAGMQRPGAQPPVVVVGVAGGWAAASAGLRHAAETATAAQGLTDRPWYDARRLDTDLLLWRLRDHPDLAAFVDRAIGPLRDHDLRSKPPLLPTLETYLAHAGRKAETARELHLNRQTLYNRLARIGELLGTDLDEPQTVLALSLALRARRHVP